MREQGRRHQPPRKPAARIATPSGVHYDQLMMVAAARRASRATEAFIRIYNNDGSESGPALRQRHALRGGARGCSRTPGRTAATFETRAGLLDCLARGTIRRFSTYPSDMGPPKFGLEGHSAGRKEFPRHPLDRSCR